MPQDILPLKTSRRPPDDERLETTNLSLRHGVKVRAAEIARDRYGFSLSHLVDRLLEEECRGKKGILHILHEGSRSEHVRGKRLLASRL